MFNMLARFHGICTPAWPFINALLIVFVLGACARLPAALDRRAQELIRAGDFTAAAKEYLYLAQISKPPASYTYVLQAAEAHLAAHQVDAASQLLAGLKLPPQETDLIAWEKVLWARAALLKNDPSKALAALEGLRGAQVPAWLQREFYRCRADAYSAKGDLLRAVQERILLEPLLTDPEEQRENRQAIWEAVNQLSPFTLSQRLPAQSNMLRGWMELARIVRAPHLDSAAFRQSLEAWQQRFPDHPAALEILADLREAIPAFYLEVKRIALLLPLAGKFADAAVAIRDGFLTAWHQDAENTKRPAVTVYDANITNISTVYQQALDEGADVVIGPLEKPAIENLVSQDIISVPTLALNQLDPDAYPAETPSWAAAHDQLYQFALSPEDEARQVAERTWLDGYVRAAVLTPQSDWGQRVFKAFKQSWERLGGQVRRHQSYTHDAPSYSMLIEEFLQDAAGPPGASETGQQDIDFIFLAGFPAQARQIHPEIALRASIPVYSTSHIYAGVDKGQEADHRLDDIIFGDMPWILDTDPESARLREAVLRQWPDHARAYMRFYAFGIDAYRLVPHLAFLRAHASARFAGETGSLRIDRYGRIHRQLTWARFVNGKPLLLEPRSQ